MKKVYLMALAALAAFAFAGCDTEVSVKDVKEDARKEAEKLVYNHDTLYQTALLQSLTLGNFDGSITVGDFRKKGDTGLGTFQSVNGEMIMLDGKVYRAAWDGTVEEVKDDETIPFAATTHFDEDYTIELTNIDDLETLTRILSDYVNEKGKNYIYCVKVEGDFDTLNLRSVKPQTKPYKTLAEAMKSDQVFFDYENLGGTIVGVYCPNYLDGVNFYGWHMHFLSNDREKGGHLLGVKFSKATVKIDLTIGVDIFMPDTDKFQELNLAADQGDDIKTVEAGRK